jgi:hypothetical protein
MTERLRAELGRIPKHRDLERLLREECIVLGYEYPRLVSWRLCDRKSDGDGNMEVELGFKKASARPGQDVEWVKI